MDRAIDKPAEHMDLVVNDAEERIRQPQRGRERNAQAKRDRDAAARRRSSSSGSCAARKHTLPTRHSVQLVETATGPR